jgi:hypothetical protein
MTKPLFFASNAIHLITLMLAWLQVSPHGDALTYQVDALPSMVLAS